ncbi:stage II sporulation protein M [Marinicrinis lubricantis]|uniref:Stage II sporulation protein M n=1 Tax=Marinicrinis lubricantis TaxID=2086470 RepID=A0ABW1ISH5_9BACL
MQLKMKKMTQEYLPLTIFVSVLFIMGVVFGALLVNALSLEQKQDMYRYLGSFFNDLQGVAIDASDSFKQVFGMHLKWILLIWVLGLSVVGLPLVFILIFLKGVLVGFSVGYLVSELSWKGMLFALASIAPQNILIIPSLILSSVLAVVFSMFVIKNRLIERKGSVSQAFTQYSFGMIGFMFVLFGASLLEAFLSPVLMKWVTPIIQTAAG